jgi:hypothetical protein
MDLMRNFLFGVATGISLVAAAGAGYGAGRSGNLNAVIPDSVFAVSHSGNSLLRVNVDGKVGVGTSDPQSRLHVHGAIRSDSAGFVFPDNTTLETRPSLIITYRTHNAESTLNVAPCEPGEVVIGGGGFNSAHLKTTGPQGTGAWVTQGDGAISTAIAICLKATGIDVQTGVANIP